jgi:hypothetical protein
VIARLDRLRKHPAVFRALTGVTPGLFDALVVDALPAPDAADSARRDRPDRDRAVGAGHPTGLTAPDRLLRAVVWLGVYPTHAVLGYPFGVSESAARRLPTGSRPAAARTGRDPVRMPDPGKHRRRSLPALLKGTPGLAVRVDTFEPPTHRPRRRERAYDSGKRRRHTLTTRVGVDEGSGRIAHVPPAVPGPSGDLTVPRRSGLLGRLPAGVGVIGDTAYPGIGAARPDGPSATPRREPKGEPRPAADRRYSRALARRRVTVEHTTRRVRVFRALTRVNRHGRTGDEVRVRAVAGLANRLIDARPAA